jgi:lysophospholipase L1-like esterase
MWVWAALACTPDPVDRQPQASNPQPDTDTDTDTGPGSGSGSGSTGTPDTATTSSLFTESTYVPEGYHPTQVAHVVFVGDSVTVGAGLADARDRYASLLLDQCPDCWPFDGGDLTDRFGELEVLDLSEPGMTVTELLIQHIGRIEETFGSPVTGGVLMIGTLGLGDIIFGRGTPAAEDLYIDNLGRLDDYLSDPAVFPDGAWLYLANIYDPTDGTGWYPDCFGSADMSAMTDAFESANAASRELAIERGWAWVDARSHFLGHGHHYDDPDSPYYRADDPVPWYIDCLHPNENGHHEMRRLFLSAIDGVPLEQ